MSDGMVQAEIRLLLIMAMFAFFSGPWTWQMLLLTAVLLYLYEKIGQIIMGEQ